MIDPKTPDPDKVVTHEDGTQTRPGRFTGDGAGMTITDLGDDEQEFEDDFDPDAPDDEDDA